VQHLGKNAVIAFALVGAGFALAWLRHRPLLERGGGTFTDGRTTAALADVERLRFAVWDAPEPLAGAIGGPGHESHTTVAPDGRTVVFASGERGVDADLYVGVLEGGRVTDVRPLHELNTPFDEVAPRFGAAGLHFASNRPGGAGGLDLYRASFGRGEFGPTSSGATSFGPTSFGTAEWQGGALASPHDDTDPAPRPGTLHAGREELVFASSRGDGGRTFDLYRALPVDERGRADFDVVALGELCSPHDERDPAFTAGGLALVFATNRGASLADSDFDLVRAVRLPAGGFAPGEPLHALNTEADERGPDPSADGFELRFARDLGSGAGFDVLVARSRELYRAPGAPPGWREVLLVVLLLLLALLAWAAKHWRAMDVVYRCFLVSLVAHLAIAWWFQRVHPEPEPTELAQREGARVRVVLSGRDADGAARRALGGELAVARHEDGSDGDAAPSATSSASSSAAAHALAAGAASRPAAAALPASQAASLRFESAQPAAAAPAPLDARAERGAFARVADLPDPTADVVARAVRERALAERRSATEDGPAPTAAHEPAAFARTPAPTSTTPAATAVPTRATLLAGVVEPRDGRDGAPPNGTSSSDSPPSGPPQKGALAFAAEARAQEPSSELAGVALATAARPVLDADQHGRGGPPLAAPTLPGAPRRAVEGSDAAAATAATFDVREPAAFARALPVDTARTPAVPRLESLRSVDAALADAPRPLELVAAAAVEAGTSAAPLPTALDATPYRTRFGAAKDEALREHGGSRATEAAVARGLAYLASIQRADGSWCDPRDVSSKYGLVGIGRTGLCVLAFLGAGHTPDSGSAYSSAVARALAWLVDCQTGASGHIGRSDAYGHGIATYALAEAFALTRDEGLRAPVERAVQRVLAMQRTRGPARERGGWGYYGPDGPYFDEHARTSITAWQVMALESARLAGVDVPDAAFDAARAFLLSAWDEDLAAFRYSHDPARLDSTWPTLPASTPAALFALSLLGEDVGARRYDRARGYVLERATRDYAYRGDDAFVLRGQGNVYFTYYATLAMFRVGGPAFEEWNRALVPLLVDAQRSDGAFEPLSSYATEYAMDDPRDAAYSTAMAVLCLEVYYRYFTPLLTVAPRVPRDDGAGAAAGPPAGASSGASEAR
jgi:hypothetical protein